MPEIKTKAPGGTFAPLRQSVFAVLWAATVLGNGRVLFAGRGAPEWDSGVSAELYDPATGTWAATGDMVTPRLCYSASLLPDGRVLVTGGTDNEYGGAVLSSAELYEPATGTWRATAPMASARRNHTATVLANGVAMTVFCWHMTALVAVIGLAGLVGLELGDQATLGWWLARPLWVLLPGVVLAGLVALFRGVETGRR